MLFLQKIIITHFKNYEISSFDFSSRVVGICGRNGIGKTNLLDAIHYCSFTKSYFSGTDLVNTGTNKEGFRLQAEFKQNDFTQQVVCVYKINGKKDFFLDEVPYEKLSHHIGLLPCVMIAPDDIDIINGGSELRRKFLDTLLSQLDKEYLQHLIVYNKVLLQRNSFLKQAADKGNLDKALLEIFDEQLSKPAAFIYKKRIEYTTQLLELVDRFYKQISQNEEQLNIKYVSQLHEDKMESLLLKSREKDRILNRTNVGIHKDDVVIEFEEHLFKNIASQGQKKSLLFALKLAEYEMIKSSKGFYPILMLDDVFEKLDRNRMDNLLDWVCVKNNGQVFITDTHKERIEDTFVRLGIEGQVVELEG